MRLLPVFGAAAIIGSSLLGCSGASGERDPEMDGGEGRERRNR
jgi:hypothetical protein